MRVKLVGVHKVRAKGKTYCYAWRGGPRIDAKEDTKEFLAEYLRLTRHRAVDAQEGTFGAIVAEYRASASYRDLAPATRRRNDPILQAIMQEFGDMPVELVEAKGARRDFVRWREEMKDTPRTADMHISVLKRVLSWAVDNEHLTINKLAGVKRQHHGSRAEMIWSDEECHALSCTASTFLATALNLALTTGQRQGDLLRMTWQAYDGSTLTLKQRKTGANVRLKCSPELKALLDGLPKTAVTILTNSRGLPWTSWGFQASWRKAMAKAGITGLTFHDLRGTAVTRMYRDWNWSFREIAEVTGHSEKDCEAIIRKHYLATDLSRRNGTNKA